LTKPGLVLYDIWQGNGAGLFLEPRSPHGADTGKAGGLNHAWPGYFDIRQERHCWSDSGRSCQQLVANI